MYKHKFKHVTVRLGSLDWVDDDMIEVRLHSFIQHSYGNIVLIRTYPRHHCKVVVTYYAGRTGTEVKKAIKLALVIYRLTGRFPAHGKY